jgi:beta-glucuronidase
MSLRAHFRLFSFAFGVLCLAAVAQAETPLINVYARQALNLDGKWNIIVDPYENGFYDYRHQPYDASPTPTGGYFLDHQPADKSELIEYNFDRSPALTVPGDWNSQEERLFYYEGTVWYRRKFDCSPVADGTRLFLYFGAANYRADIYLNGKKLGQHLGGFTPFSFEITGLVRVSGNSLVVRVDNQRHADAVPTVNTDWWNYGGLTRDVLLVQVPSTYIHDYRVQLKKGSRDRIEASLKLDGPQKQQRIKISIPEAGLSSEISTDINGVAHWEVPAPKLELWSPAHPRLYTVEISCETDRTSEKIGFRTIETRGTDILLNGESIFLRGISLHEENPLRGGRAYSVEDARLLLGWAKELNCNFVRLAHYPHNEHMARVADELGLMLWEEIPVYWTIQWENTETLYNAQNQLTDLRAL